MRVLGAAAQGRDRWRAYQRRAGSTAGAVLLGLNRRGRRRAGQRRGAAAARGPGGAARPVSGEAAPVKAARGRPGDSAVSATRPPTTRRVMQRRPHDHSASQGSRAVCEEEADSGMDTRRFHVTKGGSWRSEGCVREPCPNPTFGRHPLTGQCEPFERGPCARNLWRNWSRLATLRCFSCLMADSFSAGQVWSPGRSVQQPTDWSARPWQNSNHRSGQSVTRCAIVWNVTRCAIACMTLHRGGTTKAACLPRRSVRATTLYSTTPHSVPVRHHDQMDSQQRRNERARAHTRAPRPRLAGCRPCQSRPTLAQPSNMRPPRPHEPETRANERPTAACRPASDPPHQQPSGQACGHPRRPSERIRKRAQTSGQPKPRGVPAKSRDGQAVNRAATRVLPARPRKIERK